MSNNITVELPEDLLRELDSEIKGCLRAPHHLDATPIVSTMSIEPLSLQSNLVVAVVGPSGSGKTALVNQIINTHQGASRVVTGTTR